MTRTYDITQIHDLRAAIAMMIQASEIIADATEQDLPTFIDILKRNGQSARKILDAMEHDE